MAVSSHFALRLFALGGWCRVDESSSITKLIQRQANYKFPYLIFDNTKLIATLMGSKEIIAALMELLDSQEILADEMGVSQAAVSGWVNGGGMRGDNLERLHEVARKYGLDPNAKEKRSKPESEHEEEKSANMVRIKELDARFGAGSNGVDNPIYVPSERGGYVNQDAFRDGEWGLPPTYLQSELRMTTTRAIVVEVFGDSGYDPSNPHAPGSLFPGDRVIIDTGDRRPSPPGAFALYDGTGLVIKMIEAIPGTEPQRLSLTSRNPGYRTYEITQDEANIIGRVRGRITGM